MKQTISIKMLNTLCKGKDNLSGEAQERIREYIRSQMDDCAFFVDKSGRRDVYYTVFGLMLSYVFGVKVDCSEAHAQLEVNKPDEHDLIHYAAYTRSKMLLKLLDGNKVGMILSRLFYAGGKTLPAFTRFPHNDPNSPYSVFILLSLLEDMGRRLNDKKKMLESLEFYHVNGGGYSNIAGMSMSANELVTNELSRLAEEKAPVTEEEAVATVNATAAALCVRGQLEGYNLNDSVEYLSGLQDDSGGFFATVQSPVPDILSTATALFVLSCYKKAPLVNPGAFVEAHWLDSGGFAPTLLENESDIEYTFYGILALGTC